MTTPELEEVIARAIRKHYLHGNDPRWWTGEGERYMQKRLDEEWPLVVPQARAVLAALKDKGIVCVPEEPTEAMVEAMAAVDVDPRYDSERGYTTCPGDCRAIYRAAMIRAAGE